MTDAEKNRTFRLAYVPGVTPTKWVRVWKERIPDVRLELVSVLASDADEFLREGNADVGLVRLPVDRTDLSAIPLYTEVSVVVVPKDHVFNAVEGVSVSDLEDELVLDPVDSALDWVTVPGVHAEERPASTADAVELVAAGVGVVVVPQSLARLHHRKDLTYRPVTDAPRSQIALAWREDHTTELVEEFIGIVRGRTANSSRGRVRGSDDKTPHKKTAPKKAAPKKAARRTPPPTGRSSTKRGGGSRRGRSR